MPEEGELTQGESNYEEEWVIVLNNKSEYRLSKIQAQILQQAIAQGERGIVIFKTFSISIPYIVEFFREKKYIKGQHQLPEKAKELEYEPISNEKFEKIKKEAYANIGKPLPKKTPKT